METEVKNGEIRVQPLQIRFLKNVSQEVGVKSWSYTMILSDMFQFKNYLEVLAIADVDLSNVLWTHEAKKSQLLTES